MEVRRRVHDARGRKEGSGSDEYNCVDIYLEGANAMKARLEATWTEVSCAGLEKEIDAAWRAQQADIERAQDEFHAVDETTARSEREALQARLDGTRAQLEPGDAEIRRLDTELADLRRQVDAGRADLVAQHNALIEQRRAVAEDYDRLVADANGLIDALNWARW
jgi:septal ring factor EnvC (AmiA/AmiB activator)